MSRRENRGETVLAVICAIAAIIAICVFLFPYLAFLTVILFVGLVFAAYAGYDTSLLSIAFVICLILTGVTYLIGHIFGDSPIGKAITTIGNTVQTREEIQQNATLAIVDVAQNVTTTSYGSLNNSNKQPNEALSNFTYDAIRVGIKNS